MTLYATLLQVAKQFRFHWLRLALASLGILIGVWSIALTSSLSLSAADTIVTAINSQDGARGFTLAKTNSAAGSFDFNQTSTALGLSEVEDLVDKYPTLEYAYPNVTTEAYFARPNEEVSCTVEINELRERIERGDVPPSQIQESRKALENTCQSTLLDFTPLAIRQEQNADQWLGSTQDLQAGEIAVCYECSENNPLFERLEVTSPTEMLGQSLQLEVAESPATYTPGETVELLDPKPALPFEEPRVLEYTIAAVFDDREVETNVFAGDLNNVLYLPLESYPDLLREGSNLEGLSFLGYSARATSFEELEVLTNELSEAKYTPNAPTLSIVQGITYFFYGVSVVLGLFGIIALVASMFGIVNVMTISVLRRQKEIGILKALGAGGRDIFNIFILESALLGILGWFFGIVVTWLSLLLVSGAFGSFVLDNAEWRENLESFNITSFEPALPWYIALVTLAIALFFTLLSGLVPALRAARKNPVDVLR